MISFDQQPGVSYSLFLLYLQVKDYQNILKLKCKSLAYTLYKAFFRNKKRPLTSLPASIPV